jgi:hypothetical protein
VPTTEITYLTRAVRDLSVARGRAIAQALSRWLPTEATRFRARVRSWGFCGQSGTGARFLRVLQFPLPIFSPPFAPQSPSSTISGWYNRPLVAAVPSGLNLIPLTIIIIENSIVKAHIYTQIKTKISITSASFFEVLFIMCQSYNSVIFLPRKTNPIEVQMEHLPNTCLERYRYVILPGFTKCCKGDKKGNERDRTCGTHERG